MVILEIIAKFVSLFLSVSSFGMAARMILPLFVEPEESKLYIFSCVLSEPIVAPVRSVLYAFGIDDSLPFDVALPAAYLILFVIQLFLPAI